MGHPEALHKTASLVLAMAFPQVTVRTPASIACDTRDLSQSTLPTDSWVLPSLKRPRALVLPKVKVNVLEFEKAVSWEPQRSHPPSNQFCGL